MLNTVSNGNDIDKKKRTKNNTMFLFTNKIICI